MSSNAPPGTPRPLAGRTIAITRPADRGRGLAARLEAAGADVRVRPLIETVEPRSGEAFDAALARLADFDWIVVTSVNGAAAFARRAREKGAFPTAESTPRIAAVGEATAARLRDEGLNVDLVPSRAESEGLLEALPVEVLRGR
jgi:uroporphyrinogen III methyltransferase/synthase